MELATKTDSTKKKTRSNSNSYTCINITNLQSLHDVAVGSLRQTSQSLFN
jgi:hypothetical protein